MKYTYLLVVATIAALTLLLCGCGHHLPKRLNVSAVASSTVYNVDTQSIAGTTVSFWDQLSDAERKEIIDELRNELALYEAENEDSLEGGDTINIEVILTNNIDNNIEVDIDNENNTILVGRPRHRPHWIPRRAMHHHLCKARKKRCKKWCRHNSHSDDD